MEDSPKQTPTKLGGTPHSSAAFGARKFMPFAYCLTFAFIFCAILFLFNNPSSHSRFSTIFSHLFPNIAAANSVSPHDSISRSQLFTFSLSQEKDGFSEKTNSLSSAHEAEDKSPVTFSRENDGFSGKTNNLSDGSNQPSSSPNKTEISGNQVVGLNGTIKGYSDSLKNDSSKGVNETKIMPNHTAVVEKQRDGANGGSITEQRKENLFDLLSHCDIFDGSWVKDDSYPLYAPGSCPFIDEPFDCFHNGRIDNGYEKYKWKPKGCNIPRLNARDLLELLRGKRLVYVGDSLNRNMWESMVCALRNSVTDKSKVFEASGKQEFRTQHSYSFRFVDYNCTVEFFRSTFLVQEWEMPDSKGSKKETLRLDLVERSSDRYKNADILVFNTGHWWTHEKTTQGKGYYQEGSHVYGELDVVEAFRKAMTTWARWIDANVNPTKTLVFFRGYSASHFSGGQWNSGGQCDSETEPFTNEAYLAKPLPIMSMLERVMNGMRTPVFYLNVTKMTDFRKDAHPSIYRKQNLTEEEKRSPLRFQDCSHWCLPGVPDTWNELLYALIKHNQKQRQQQQKTP